MKTKTQTGQPQLAIIQPHTAGIDVGSMLMMIAYTNAEGNQVLIETDGFTESLEDLANRLKEAGVQDVAMEATGVYWMSLYGVLEKKGLKVTLINAAHFKNVLAQKTDVQDCQWIQQLHAHGLLRNSHIAPEIFRELKNYLHERNLLQDQKRDTLNRIHRVLTLMNIKIQHLISDIEGVAGMKIVRGIASGVSDPEQLLALIGSSKLKSSPEDLLKSLKGIYKEQFVVILTHALEAYDFFKGQMKVYEKLIEKVLIKMLPEDEKGSKPIIEKKKGLVRKNQYGINLQSYLYHITGVDLTRVDGLEEISILDIISVTGTDMSKWPTGNHFSSWLNLTARPKITGGRIFGHQKRVTNNRATQAFRMAAQTMWQNKGPLGNLYKRLAAQKGSSKAVKAVARKLSVIFYNMMRYKTPFDKTRLEANAEKQNAKRVAYLQREAKKYGYSMQSIVE
jgi:transposase